MISSVSHTSSPVSLTRPHTTASVPVEKPLPPPSVDTLETSKKTADSPSLIRRVGEWLYGLFWSSPATAVDAESLGEPLSSKPKLESPDEIDARKLRETIANVNHHLIHRLEDTRADEEVHNKQNEFSFMLHLFLRGMRQRELKEELSLFSMAEVQHNQSLNKLLNQQATELMDEVRNWSAKRKIPEWIGVFSTYGTTGAIALTFATGGFGAISAVLAPIMTITKTAASGVKAYFDHNAQKKQAELFKIGNDRSLNTEATKAHVSVIKAQNDDSLATIRLIKNALTNYQKTAQALQR